MARSVGGVDANEDECARGCARDKRRQRRRVRVSDGGDRGGGGGVGGDDRALADLGFRRTLRLTTPHTHKLAVGRET